MGLLGTPFPVTLRSSQVERCIRSTLFSGLFRMAWYRCLGLLTFPFFLALLMVPCFLRGCFCTTPLLAAYRFALLWCLMGLENVLFATLLLSRISSYGCIWLALDLESSCALSPWYAFPYEMLHPLARVLIPCWIISESFFAPLELSF